MKRKPLILLLLICSLFITNSFAQKTALLLIDIQDFYFPGGDLPLENPEEAAVNAGLVLQDFRKTNQLIVHVKHAYEPGGSIHEFVSPHPGEKIITKKDVNSFLNTDLKEFLDSNGVEELVICGMQTHMCVEGAVRAAHDFGYKVILLQDACATRSLQYADKIITAEDVHLSTLKTLDKNYCEVKNTADYLLEYRKMYQ